MARFDFERIDLENRPERQQIGDAFAIIGMIAALQPAALNGIHLLRKSKMRFQAATPARGASRAEEAAGKPA
jgi:hypothetical protein